MSKVSERLTEERRPRPSTTPSSTWVDPWDQAQRNREAAVDAKQAEQDRYIAEKAKATTALNNELHVGQHVQDLARELGGTVSGGLTREGGTSYTVQFIRDGFVYETKIEVDVTPGSGHQCIVVSGEGPCDFLSNAGRPIVEDEVIGSIVRKGLRPEMVHDPRPRLPKGPDPDGARIAQNQFR